MKIHAGKASALRAAAIPRVPAHAPDAARRSHRAAIAPILRGSRPGAATPATTATIDGNVVPGAGEPLPEAERGFFEPRLGRDLGAVRIHTGSQAAGAASALGARAFTLGHDIVFAGGEYRPGTRATRSLLAHELVHVVQQSAGLSTPMIQRRTGAGNCARPTETVDEQRDELARAGRRAHEQVQGAFALALSSEVPIPRATKNQRSATCPPGGTPIGKADLWRFGGGLSDVEVAEIKSIHGRAYAAPDVAHYLTRLRELAGRATTGQPCPGPADAADRAFDSTWLGGNLARGRVPGFTALDAVVPTTPTPLGPFWGDPLYKNLSCERRTGGAVLYWCTDRRLRDDERERERVRLGIPRGEHERRTQPVQGTRPPVLIDVHPGFREAPRQLPPQVPAERIYIMVVPDALFTEVDGAMRMERNTRLMRIDMRRHPIFQFRTITWTTLAVVLAVGTLGLIVVAVGAAAAVPATAAVGAGAVGTGGAAGAAGGGGAVVIPLFTSAASQELAKAAAVVIVTGTLAAGSSEAHAAQAVQRGMSDPRVGGTVDITDDPFALSGGYRAGSHVTIDGRPYRVIGSFHSR